MRLKDYPRPAIAREQVDAHGDRHLYNAAIARHLPFITAAAEQLSWEEEDLADDLVQVAQIVLWQIDCSRYGEADDAFVRRRLYTAMLDTRRRELSRRRIILAGQLRRKAISDY